MGTLSPWPETLSNSKKRVIQQLVHGQECATQLQILFHNPSEEGGRLSAEEVLVQNILTSFNHTLAALTCIDSSEVSQNQTTCNDDSPWCEDRRSEGCSESSKRPGSKEKRGCYKRKRDAEAWTVVSATMEDGQAWRKYGQKKILNSIHPRSYFRCTRKYEQGCRAMKQVQRMEDDPQMYEITYIGTHTCTDSFRAPQIIPDSESWESQMGSHSQIPTKHHHLNPAAFPSVKQEAKEAAASDVTDMDCMVWKEIMGGGGGFEYSSEHGMGCDYGDCRAFQYEFLKPAEIDHDYHFDESECLIV
ncbi:hypothetical protein Gotur_032892 [Gossypium turneri]